MAVAARKDYFGCPGKLFWLAKRIESMQFRTCLTYASSFSLFCLRLRQNANTTLSLRSPMKFGDALRVETSRYLTKITTLWKTDREQLKVLAAKHRRSLRLPCTAVGNQAKLNACRIRNLRKGGGSWSCTWLYNNSLVRHIIGNNYLRTLLMRHDSW